MVLVFSLKETYDRKTLPGSVHVTNLYTDVLLGFVAVVGLNYLASSKTQMGKCQSAELVSTGTWASSLLLHCKPFLVLENVCCCAVRKIITISFHPSQPGPSGASAERGPVLSTSRQANGSGTIIYLQQLIQLVVTTS